jgi:hypothetical protein
MPTKRFQERYEDVNPSFRFHLSFYIVIMLEWRVREHEDEYYFVRNDPRMVNSLQQCELLEFFKIQGMRPQLRLLEYLVHMWDVDQQVFCVGAYIIVIDIEDIYLLIRLSHCGPRVTLTSSRGGGKTMIHYINAHYMPNT